MSCGLTTLHNNFLVLWICNFTTASNLQLQIRMECILDRCPECTLDFTASHFQPYLAGLYHSRAPIKTITFTSKNCTETPAVKTNSSHTYNTDGRECDQGFAFSMALKNVNLSRKPETTSGPVFWALRDFIIQQLARRGYRRCRGLNQRTERSFITKEAVLLPLRISSHWTKLCELWLRVGVPSRHLADK